MKPFPKVHDLYVMRVVVATIVLTWCVLMGLDLLNAMVSEFDDIGKGNYGFFQALTYVAYSIPRRAYMLFPTAAVIGALMGLGQMAANSELTALRAVGISRKRLSISVIMPVIAITALMVLNAETLAPKADAAANALKASSKSKDMAIAQYTGLWAREGDTFLNAQTGQEKTDGNDAWLELNNVMMFELEEDGRLKSIARATLAEHRATGWLLRNVSRTSFGEREVKQTTVAEERWASKLDAAALAANTRNIWRPRYMSSEALKNGITYRKRNNLDATEFEEHYWSRWFYPVSAIALCLAAIPFAFGSLRSGGAGKRLFIGIIFALGFWLLQLMFVQLAGVYKFDFRLAYSIPPIVMLLVSVGLFRRRSS